MLTDSDIEWLKIYHPGLSPIDNYTVEGKITFIATYNSTLNKFLILYPGVLNSIGGVEIHDEYKVTIKSRPTDNPLGLKLPGLFIETSRFELIEDRHFNIDKSACLCGPIEEITFWDNGFTFQNFFNQFIVPFLYEQTYYDLYNQIWPWDDYSHGGIGALESYYENKYDTLVNVVLSNLKDPAISPKILNWIQKKKLVKGHIDCICGSGIPIRNCHTFAWYGLNKLISELSKQ